LKDIKVHGLRASYSIRDDERMNGKEHEAVQTRYGLVGKGVFHLTVVGLKFVLSRMTRSSNSRVEVKRPGIMARLLERSQLGWRKVATGAAALLALGMGYHVVFGQNGLTAYQQKRQDTHILDQQLHSWQKENEQLKGHVERLQNDPNAIEHQAREELHYTRPGEVIYTLPASSNSSASTNEPVSSK
jgi:cell division protein FtsB